MTRLIIQVNFIMMPRPVNVSKSSINFLFLILEKTSLHNVFLAKSLMDTPKFSTTNYEKTQDKGGIFKGSISQERK